MWRVVVCIILITCKINLTYAGYSHSHAITETIPVSDINNYKNYPVETKELISNANSLIKKKLTYLFGSEDPRNGGMDCSGTIKYLLENKNVNDVPRQSSEMYQWVKQEGNLHKVRHNDFSSQDFSKLKPGDLLFWSGTYAVHHNPPISHVMIYLGKNKDGEPLMFGSSSGRTYKGHRMRGVSVYDFLLPSGRGRAKFEGYSCIPHLTCNSGHYKA